MRILDNARASRPAGGGRSAYLWWVIWIIWIPFFAPPFIEFAQQRPMPLWLAVSSAGVLLFFALYLWITLRCAQYLASPTPQPRPTGATLWAPIVATIALSVTFTLANGAGWGALLIYTSTCAAGWLPLRQATSIIAGLALFTVIGISLRLGVVSAVTPVAFIIVPGFVVVALVQSVSTSQKLRAAQAEMARVAVVTDERLRFARDLHDLLGHTLSLIALKSELARRLAPVAPERAVAEISDIEAAARQALQEVREAVAGYRQPTLTSELYAAREILAAAGVSFTQHGEAPTLPTGAEAALSWMVREGVTNVIRHSHARNCALTITRDGASVRLELVDDGRSANDEAASPTLSEKGNGLSGLRERVLALGGSVEACPAPDGGFRLVVWLPVATPTATAAPAPDAAETQTSGERKQAS